MNPAAALITLFLFLVPPSPILAFSVFPNNTSNLQNATTITRDNSEVQGNNLTSYNNPIHSIKIEYPSDWKVVERADNGYHMLNVVAEFLQSNQSSYFSSNISASHNSLRISVENYSAFEDTQDNNISNMTENQLQNIGNHRIGSIGISCPGFDLKSYVRNATLAGSPAYKISFDYSYLDNTKKAIEIWTVKDGKSYIIDYVANEQVYDATLLVVQKMIESFGITA
jgi:hypothetical protein